MQRTGPWDTLPLYGHTAADIVAVEQTPVLDVSRHAYIGGFDNMQTADARAVFEWYAENPPATALGSRAFQLASSIPSDAQYRLPNLGPFLQITWTPLGGGTPFHTCQVIGTNRVHPLEFIPALAQLLDRNTVAVNTGATLTSYPNGYYAGPVQASVHATQAMTLIFDYLDPADAWQQFFVQSVPAGGWQYVNVLTPPGAWRTRVTNASGVNGTVDLHVQYSLTGGS